MIRYSSSLLYAIFIHLALFGSLFAIYTTLSIETAIPAKKTLQEKKIVLCLNEVTIQHTPEVKKSTLQKQHKRKKKPQQPAPQKKRKKILKKEKKEIYKPKQKTKKIQKQKLPPMTKEPQKQLSTPKPQTPPNIEKTPSTTQSKKVVTATPATDPCPHPPKTHKPKEEPIQYSQKYYKLNIEQIMRLVEENLYYPRKARKRGIEGKVVVQFRLKTDASIDNIKILQSTHEILSRAAIKTIDSLEGELENPAEQVTLTLPIMYKLEEG